jgi:hypothetical protein
MAFRTSVISSPQKRLADLRIGQQGRPAVGIGIAPLHQNKAAIGNFQRLTCVLFDHQHGNAGLCNLDDAVKQLIHDDRRDTGGWFIQHQHLRLGHQGTANGHLLTLAAGQLTRRLPPLFIQHGKQRIDLLLRLGDIIAADKGPHLQIFLDRHAGKDILVLRDESHAFQHALLRFQAGDILTIQYHPASAQAKHPEHRLHRG